MAVIIPEAVFKNTFAMKINKSTCKKEMQQCMQQKLERLQFQAKIFFLQETLPSPLLTNLIKSIFFPLFLPKYTKCILEGKKKIPSHALVSHSITGFSTLNQLVTDFASKRKTAFCHSSFCLYITITFRQVRSLANLSEYLNRALANRFWYCEKECELKPSFLSKDGQWTQAQKHLKAPERQLSVFISNVFPKDHDSH